MHNTVRLKRSIAVGVLVLAVGIDPTALAPAASGAAEPVLAVGATVGVPRKVTPAIGTVNGRRVLIKVKGQRFGKKTTVTLKGYRGKARGTKRRVRVRATKTLKRLKPGKYRVTAKRITWKGGVAKPKKIKPRRVTVSKWRGARTTITYRQTRKPTTPRRLSRLRLQDVKRRWGESVSVAVAPLTSHSVVGVSGRGRQHAWSTIKPLFVSQILVDVGGPDRLSGTMRRWIRSALSTSSNEAAYKIYERLGRRHGGSWGASAALTGLLRQSGDQTTVVAPGRTREKFPGLTIWTPKRQALYLREVVRRCVLNPAGTRFLLREMSHVVPEQSWGLGSVGSTAFKGGWGPDRKGRYLVRQFGVLEATDGSRYVAAISVRPKSGTFNQGTRLITKVAKWLKSSVASAPAPDRCKP